MKNALDIEVEKLSEEERRLRLDLYYSHYAGKHVIIELKRYSAKPSFNAIYAQCRNYRNVALKALEENGRRNELVEVIVILGQEPSEWLSGPSRNTDSIGLLALNANIVTYDNLIDNARSAYRGYIEQHEKVGRIYRLIERMSEKDSEVLSGAE